MKEKPKMSKGDIAHKIVKAGLTMVPLAGSPAAELFNSIITPPLAKRRDEWIESIIMDLKKLEEKIEDFDIENLSKNEMFITAVMHASRSAIRNHQKEKLEALRNAVLNSTSRNAPDEDLQLMFLNWVDELTPWHLRILKFFENPKKWFEKNNMNLPNLEFGAPSHALTKAYTELNNQRNFYDQIVSDLHSRGLLNIESLHTTMTRQGVFASRTSDMGNQFIQFITSPFED